MNFKCEICLTSYDTSVRLECHKQIHYKRFGPYDCYICNKSVFAEILQKHLEYHTDDGLFKCKLCAESYIFIYGVHNHERLYHYICECCKIVLNTRHDFNEHCLQHSECEYFYKINGQLKTSYWCSLCDWYYNTMTGLFQHINTRHYKCKVCCLFFRDSDDINQHKVQLHNFLVCEKCNLPFENQCKCHIRDKCDKSSGHICQTCDVHFNTIEQLINHNTVEHLAQAFVQQTTQNQFTKCTTCDTRVKNPDELYNHQIEQHDYRLCQTCRQLFPTQGLSEYHLHCRTCNEPFITSKRLWAHEQIHLDHNNF